MHIYRCTRVPLHVFSLPSAARISLSLSLSTTKTIGASMERWSKLPRWAMVGRRCSHQSPTRWARMRVVASRTPKHGWRQGSVATSTSAHCKRAKPVHLHRPISLSHPRSWRPARGWHLNRRRNQMNPSLTSSWIKGETRWVATPWNHCMRVLAVRRHKPWHVQWRTVAAGRGTCGAAMQVKKKHVDKVKGGILVLSPSVVTF